MRLARAVRTLGGAALGVIALVTVSNLGRAQDAAPPEEDTRTLIERVQAIDELVGSTEEMLRAALDRSTRSLDAAEERALDAARSMDAPRTRFRARTVIAPLAIARVESEAAAREMELLLDALT